MIVLVHKDPMDLVSEPNPFNHDAYHMGWKAAKNIMVMHYTFEDQTADYIKLVNLTTGEVAVVWFRNVEGSPTYKGGNNV